jgi:hypothetical protein
VRTFAPFCAPRVPAPRLVLVATVAATALLTVVTPGCNEKLQAVCTADPQCLSGEVCNTTVLGGVCSTRCNALSMDPGANGTASAADAFCRAQLGNDDEDSGGVLWSCGPSTGACYRANACATDADCLEGKLCNTTVKGALVAGAQRFTCLASCKTDASVCPVGTICDSGTGKCIKGCETDPTQCTSDQVCQVKVSTPAMCTGRCPDGFDCSAQGEFRCTASTGQCDPGCDTDAACGAGKVCMLTEVANPAKPNACFAPCKTTGGGTPCSVFNGRNGNTARFTCDDTGHCVAM